MKYEIYFKCLNNPELDIKHHTNDYDQAEHFFWAMVLKLKSAHDKIDTNSWQLTLQINSEDTEDIKYHFSKH